MFEKYIRTPSLRGTSQMGWAAAVTKGTNAIGFERAI
jgi:hypothetical protein